MTLATAERPTIELTQYNPLRADIEALKKLNTSLTFDYRTPAGEKNARSHIYKMREKKGDVERVRKSAKADALAYGRRVDEVAAELVGELEEMIHVHQEPLDKIKAEQQAIADAEAKRVADEKAAKEAAERAEAHRVMVEAQEWAARLQAELDAQRQQQERERIAREAAEKARLEAEAKAARERAELEARERAAQQAVIDAERAKVEAERRAIEQERKAIADAKAAAEKAEADKNLAAERAEQHRVAAEAKAKADAERAERERIAAEARAKAEQKAAVKRAIEEQERKQREAQAAREAQAKRDAEAEAARLKKKAVREGIIKSMVQDFVATAEITEQQARLIAEAILGGTIRGVTYVTT